MALRVSLFLNDKASGKLKAFAGQVKDIGFGLAKFGVVGGAAIAGISTKLAGDFSKGLREVSTLMNDVTEKDIKVMGKELESLSGKTGLAINSLVKARYDIVSSGFSNAAQSAMVLGSAAKLAVGGVTSAAQAADILTTSLNAYSLSADKAEDVADILFTTVRLGKTTMNELAASMANMLPIAKAANVRLEDSAAALALVTANGINTAEASTSLKNAFKNLAAPTDDAKKAMDAAGISVKYMDDGSMDLVATLEQFRGMPLDALKEFIPDIRAINSIQIMADKVDLLGQNIVEFDNRAGASQKAFDKMMLEFNNKILRLKNNFARIFREIGRIIIEAITPAVDGANEILETLGDIGWDNVFAKIRTEWVKLSAIFKQIFTIIFRPIPDMVKKTFIMAGKAAAWALKMGWQAAGISIKELIWPSDEQENLIKLVNKVGADAAAKFLESGNWEDLGQNIAGLMEAGTREDMLKMASDLGLDMAEEIHNKFGTIKQLKIDLQRDLTPDMRAKLEGWLEEAENKLKTGLSDMDLSKSFGESFKDLAADLDFTKFIGKENVTDMFGFNGADLQELRNAVNQALGIITDGQTAEKEVTAATTEETAAIKAEALANEIAIWEALTGRKITDIIKLKDVEAEALSERMSNWAAAYQYFGDQVQQVGQTSLAAINTFHQAELAKIQGAAKKKTEIETRNANARISRIENLVKRGVLSEEQGAAQIEIIQASLQGKLNSINDQALAKERESKRKQKKWTIAGIIMDTAAAVMKVWAGPGDPIFKTALSVATGALGVAQIAKVNAQTFAGGGSVGKAFGGGVPISDTVPALLTPGEMVSTRDASNQYGEEITRFNQMAQNGQSGASSGRSTIVYIQAVDGDSVKRMIMNNKQQFAEGIDELVRERQFETISENQF